MKTHHYLAGQEKVCHKKRPMIRIKVTSSYSREKQQIARPPLIETLSGRSRHGAEEYFFHFLSRGGNSTGHLTETDSVIITFTPAGDREGVTVFQPFSRFVTRQFQRIRPAPS